MMKNESMLKEIGKYKQMESSTFLPIINILDQSIVYKC